MPFTKIANAERKLIAADVVKDGMSEKGWCRTSTPLELLDMHHVEHEVVESVFRRNAPQNYTESNIIYAPAWVYGLWDRLEVKRWDIVMTRFLATRDDPREQEMVCSELRLDTRVPSSVREAAYNYRYKRH